MAEEHEDDSYNDYLIYQQYQEQQQSSKFRVIPILFNNPYITLWD